MKVSIEDLLCNIDETRVIKTTKIKFFGVDGYDVYNISKPFLNEGSKIIAGRVEKRDSEHSKVLFFKHIKDMNYQLDESLVSFDLQDPYFSIIDNNLVLGGTQIDEDLNYNCVKYVGKNINALKKFFTGPTGMKDIRVTQLEDKKIILFTRPQGEIGGRGQIGVTFLDDIYDISINKINNAKLLNIFEKDQWGGVNEAILLNRQKLGVLSHIAKFDDQGNRHYYATTFIYDYINNIVSDFKIIVTRRMLLKGDSKRSDLADVVFSGGIKIDGQFADVYVGAGDCEAHYIKIENPFKGYEVL